MHKLHYNAMHGPESHKLYTAASRDSWNRPWTALLHACRRNNHAGQLLELRCMIDYHAGGSSQSSPSIVSMSICNHKERRGGTGDGGRGDEAPARLAELPLRLDLGHEAVRRAGRQVAQRQLPVLRHQRARQLPLKYSRRLRRLPRAPLCILSILFSIYCMLKG